MSLSVTILGCGSSGGVPRVGGDWGLCDPNNSKNRRQRCSVLLSLSSTQGTTYVLVDTSPDMRQQMLNANVTHLDGVWYTHEHADHTHGIDELRGFYLRQRKRIPIWADATTLTMLNARFGYCFTTINDSGYPPILEPHVIEPGCSISTSGAGGTITGTPIALRHGRIQALGFRVGNLAYTPDVDDISEESVVLLENLDLWIVDALRRTPHPSHFSLSQALGWIARLKPKRAVITNMHVDMDYATLLNELPPNITPAFDGMVLTA